MVDGLPLACLREDSNDKLDEDSSSGKTDVIDVNKSDDKTDS